MARRLDRLVDLMPGAVSGATSRFATPLLAGLVGRAIKFVLETIRGD